MARASKRRPTVVVASQLTISVERCQNAVRGHARGSSSHAWIELRRAPNTTSSVLTSTRLICRTAATAMLHTVLSRSCSSPTALRAIDAPPLPPLIDPPTPPPPPPLPPPIDPPTCPPAPSPIDPPTCPPAPSPDESRPSHAPAPAAVELAVGEPVIAGDTSARRRFVARDAGRLLCAVDAPAAAKASALPSSAAARVASARTACSSNSRRMSSGTHESSHHCADLARAVV